MLRVLAHVHGLGKATTRRRLMQSLELKRHALQLLEERVACSESAQLQAAVAKEEAELQAAQESLVAAQQKKADMAAAAKVDWAGPVLWCRRGVLGLIGG